MSPGPRVHAVDEQDLRPASIDDARSGSRTFHRAANHGGPPVHALLLSFAIIFVAELGDKSQLMALAFAARFKALPILIGITVATGLVHLFSVVVGAVVGVAMPT